jgi:hypothetical protein
MRPVRCVVLVLVALTGGLLACGGGDDSSAAVKACSYSYSMSGCGTSSSGTDCYMVTQEKCQAITSNSNDCFGGCCVSESYSNVKFGAASCP